jgi:hypothetical protein
MGSAGCDRVTPVAALRFFSSDRGVARLLPGEDGPVSPAGLGLRAWPSMISRKSLAVNLIRRPFRWKGTCRR